MLSHNTTQKLATASGFFCFTMALSWAIINDPKTGLALAILPLLGFLFFRNPKGILLLLIFFLPFQSIPILAQNIAGITGAKLSNLLAAGALIVLLMQEGNLLRFRDPLEKKAMFIMAIYFLFFSISFFRSIENLSLFHQLRPELYQSSWVNYTLTFYVRPALYLIAPLIILKVFRQQKDIDTILSILMASIFLLSCAVITIGILHIGEFGHNRIFMRELCHKYLGMHYNSVGTLYIICSPIIILKAFEKHPIWLINLFLALLAILFLQSRSTLLTFAATSAMMLVMLKKKKILIVLGAVLGVAIVLYLPQELRQGFLTGLEEGSADSLLQGRASHLWIPLLKEWTADPYKLFFGVGQSGLVTSPLWASGFLVQASHAHNAFINFFLNNGIILLLILLFFIIRTMVKTWQQCRQINTPLCWALYFSIIAYLIGTISERIIYPGPDNILLLPLIAILVNIVRLNRYNASEQPTAKDL